MEIKANGSYKALARVLAYAKWEQADRVVLRIEKEGGTIQYVKDSRYVTKASEKETRATIEQIISTAKGLALPTISTDYEDGHAPYSFHISTTGEKRQAIKVTVKNNPCEAGIEVCLDIEYSRISNSKRK